MNNSDEYFNVLLNLAKTQRQLLDYSMDWEQRMPIQIPTMERSGIFGLKKTVPKATHEKSALLAQLDGLRKKAKELAPQQNGYYWWELPWEHTRDILIYNLAEYKYMDSWRFEHKWDVLIGENSNLLIFYEEGHCSSFDRSYDLDFYETSRYSSAERSEKVRQYSKKQRQQDINNSIFLHGYMIRSVDTGELYSSIDDYLLSFEHYVAKKQNLSDYKDSLSTQHQRNTVRVSSNSLHYHSIYLTGEYVISNGCLVSWNLQPYSLIDSSGDFPKIFLEKRQHKEAAVASAAFLADQKELEAVPCSLLGECFTMPLADPSSAMLYAQIITCMSQKLHCDS